MFNVSFLQRQEDVSNSAESHIVLDSKKKKSAERQGTGETLTPCQGVRRLSRLNVQTSMAEQLSSIWGGGGER